MGVEFVEEIHDCVGSQGCRANHDVFLVPGRVVGIARAEFLPLYPEIGQLLELSRQDNQRHANHEHDEQLRWPRFRLEVAVADGRESDHNKVDALEDGDVVPAAASLRVLEAAGTRSIVCLFGLV